MKQKRGQFYIVAAIMIVVTLSGIASITTYASAKPVPKTIDELSRDLKVESLRIVDYGIFNNKNLTKLLNEFTDTEFAPYFLQKTDNASVIFVYGNKSGLIGVQYDTVDTGRVSAVIGGANTGWGMVNTFANRTKIFDDGDNIVSVTLFDRNYDFEIKNNELFYFVMIEEREGEIYVEKN